MIPPRPWFLCGCLLVATCSLRAETELEQAARLLKAKRYPEAQALLERSLQANPRNAEALYLMGEWHWFQKNPKKASEYAEQAIQLNPNKASYHVLRGATLGNIAQNSNMLKAMTMVGDIRGAFEKAVQLEPANRDAFMSLFNYYANAPAIAGGGLDKAQALTERTIPLDPSRGHYLKGEVQKRRKDLGGAQAEYRQALAADPKFSLVYNVLAYVELEMKQVDMALEHFRKQVELDPDNANSYDSLADGLKAKGQLNEAIEAYRKALTLNPLYISSLRGLGQLLEQTGRRDEAIQHYRSCAQLGTQKAIPKMVTESKERLKALGVKE